MVGCIVIGVAPREENKLRVAMQVEEHAGGSFWCRIICTRSALVRKNIANVCGDSHSFGFRAGSGAWISQAALI